jgi:hypothetical protein
MNLALLTHGGRLTDLNGDGFALVLRLEDENVARVSSPSGQPPFAWESMGGSNLEQVRGEISDAVQAALGAPLDEADDWMAACLADGAASGQEATLWVAAALSHDCTRHADKGVCGLCERVL